MIVTIKGKQKYHTHCGFGSIVKLIKYQISWDIITPFLSYSNERVYILVFVRFCSSLGDIADTVTAQIM